MGTRSRTGSTRAVPPPPADLPQVDWHAVGAAGSLVSQLVMGAAALTVSPAMTAVGWLWYSIAYFGIAVAYLLVRRRRSPWWWMLWPTLCLVRMITFTTLDPAAAQLVTGLVTVFFLYAGLTQPQGRSLLLIPIALFVLHRVIDLPLEPTVVRMSIAALVWSMSSELPAFLLAHVALRQQALSIAATTDALTGARNRHGMEERLVQLRGRAFLVIVDLDNFKAYNDRFGHGAGDDLLRDFADMLHLESRRGDLVVRYGGEEFLVVLADVTQRSAERIVGRWARAWSKHSSGITFSAGVTDLSGDDSVTAADTALYSAKVAGRNRMVVKLSASTPSPSSVE